MTDPLTILTYALVATAVLLVSTGMVLRWRARQVEPVELERRRRLRVNRVGRIVEGRIVELRDEPTTQNGAGHLLVYNYEVRGVEYQAAQDISFLRHKLDLRRVAAGQAASVKYDPQNPTNSIILCEEWSGV
ncbi:MAG: hypothetical protein HY656_01290 [Acidobacteria bacterium]|nr:hypothetical protein [Acidobacteriota bacterium]